MGFRWDGMEGMNCSTVGMRVERKKVYCKIGTAASRNLVEETNVVSKYLNMK